MPPCTCGHERAEHEAGMGWDAVCSRCDCTEYTEKPPVRAAGLCTCGHEQHEHLRGHGEQEDVYGGCVRCDPPSRCMLFTERPDYARTTSFADLPVSQGARDLSSMILSVMNSDESPLGTPEANYAYDAVLSLLAAADEKDVRSLLWARRVGKL